QRGRDELRIYVRRPRGERDSESNIEDLIIKTPQGGEMVLHDAAQIIRGRSYTSIERKDGRRVLSVTADVDTDVTTSNDVIADLEKSGLPELLSRYDGLTYEFAGAQEDQRESMGALKNYYVLALLVMFVLMAVVFKSYFQPFIIMLAIPFGVVGAIIGHVIMGYGLSLISMMGIVAVSGVVVNDSLVLISATNDFRAAGMSPYDAIIAGATRRFRPILLTTLTTFFGLVPMIMETSVSARFLIPMALSLGFGVLFSTFVILILVPSVYLIGEDVRALVRRVKDYIWGAPPPLEAEDVR
ncbi:MAG: AcrB/AcrD/AcrF family protein, partial [Deltaproteobacteria bacterium CG17_big_fil_post_rev_8_21_14_2_50_63_7]